MTNITRAVVQLNATGSEIQFIHRTHLLPCPCTGSYHTFLIPSSLTVRYPRKQCCGSGSGIRCFFDPWIRDPGWLKKIKIRDDHPRSYFRELRNNFWVKIILFFAADADRDPGIFLTRIRDPHWKKFGSGINIPDPQQCQKNNYFS
jgi:hypothetical protein